MEYTVKKPSVIISEQQEGRSINEFKELIKELKIGLAEYIASGEIHPEDVDETKQAIIKLHEMLDKDDFTEDEYEFVEEYFESDDLAERTVMRRRDISVKKQRHRSYLANRSRLMNQRKRYRRTGAYKRYLMKALRKQKSGKTATGKDKTKWVNK